MDCHASIKPFEAPQWRCTDFNHLILQFVIASDASPAKQSIRHHHSTCGLPRLDKTIQGSQ
jgi:hypothetical protein